MNRDLVELVAKAVARFNSLPAEERQRHRRLQRESFIRGMTTPCEHGVLDFEQCGECRARAASTPSLNAEIAGMGEGR